MIRVICETIKGQLSGLDYVERLGGLVIPVTATQHDEAGQANSFTFPITCDAEGTACVEAGKYFDMVPNDAYKSLIYFEDRTGAVFSGWGRKYNEQNFKAQIRMVCWLNLAKMGFDSCEVTDRIIMALIKALNSTKPGPIEVTQEGWTGAWVDIEKIDLVRRAENVFAGYSFQAFPHLVIYPFDVFALDLSVTFKAGADCVDQPALSAAINCQ